MSGYVVAFVIFLVHKHQQRQITDSLKETCQIVVKKLSSFTSYHFFFPSLMKV